MHLVLLLVCHYSSQIKIITWASLYICKEIFTLDYIHEFAIDLNKLQNILKIEISAVQQ